MNVMITFPSVCNKKNHHAEKKPSSQSFPTCTNTHATKYIYTHFDKRKKNGENNLFFMAIFEIWLKNSILFYVYPIV